MPKAGERSYVLLSNTAWVIHTTSLAPGNVFVSKTEDQRREEKAQREASRKLEKQLQEDKQACRATHRRLLRVFSDCRDVIQRVHLRQYELL
ncbi:hypothetical protein CB1_001265005 [Camelus ferus]|nr:hypothetical protein CB1_001265005 [Camelus ferus]